MSYRGTDAKADIYIYDDGLASIPDSASSLVVRKQFDQVIGGMRTCYPDMSMLTDQEESSVGGWVFLKGKAAYSQDGTPRLSYLYVTGIRGHFLKLRLTMVAASLANAERQHSALLSIVAEAIKSVGRSQNERVAATKLRVTGRIRDYGRYTTSPAVGSLSPIDASGGVALSEGGKERTITESSGPVVLSTGKNKHLETTTTIPCRIGESFGFTFTLQNLPMNRAVQYRSEMIHPPIQQPDGSVQEKTVVRMTIEPGAAVPDTEIWSFLDGYKNELVPGQWTRKVYINDEEVLLLTFDVVIRNGLTPGSAQVPATRQRVLLGIQYEDMPQPVQKALGQTTGALVTAVFADTPADRAGILTGDVVIQFDQSPVSSRDHLRHLIRQSAGKTVSLALLRKTERVKTTIHLSD